ncbi:MAG: RNA-binding protein, partial [Thaumarchaeota archaeon]|nr:RNA-binding protein [Nitrososphaerota archaeon]
MKLIVKTPLDLEDIAASRILEIDPSVKLIAKPHGLKGLIVIESCGDEGRLKEIISREVPEVESIIHVDEVVEAKLEKIVQAAVKLAKDKLSDEKCFAVRTVRRGKHDFTSLDVNSAVGA